MEGKDRVMEGKDKAMQVLFICLFVVQNIAAAELDPVEFLLSKDLPKNKSQVPLPDNFKYSAGTNHKTDCCSLVLYVTIKDWSPHTPDPDDYEDSGALPEEVKEPQIGPGVVDFTLRHPQIKDGDEIFRMNYVKNEEGPQRFIINFNKCLSIEDKIFGIYASTNIVDIKDIRIVIRDGKDEDVNCEPTTTVSGTPWHVVIIVIIIAIIGWVGWLISVIVFGKKYFEPKKANTSLPQEEKAIPGAAPTETVRLTEINNEEAGDTKGGPRGGSRNITLNGGDETKVVCGPITKDNRIPFITGVIFFVVAITATIATIVYFTSNDTPSQVANDVVQSPTL